MSDLLSSLPAPAWPSEREAWLKLMERVVQMLDDLTSGEIGPNASLRYMLQMRKEIANTLETLELPPLPAASLVPQDDQTVLHSTDPSKR